MKDESRFANYNIAIRTQLRLRLAMRLTRLVKLIELEAPEEICEKEKKLVIKALPEMCPEDIALVISNFKNFQEYFMLARGKSRS